MRFFHLSDLHLGIKLYEHDLLKDQKAILDEIVALTRQYQPDAVVFAFAIPAKPLAPKIAASPLRPAGASKSYTTASPHFAVKFIRRKPVFFSAFAVA